MVFLGDYNEKKIEEVVEDFLFRRGYELVDMRLDTSTHRAVLEIYVDKLGGITVKDLSEINERLKLFLAADELLPREFSLIVSSPGLDRVLKKEADFQRFIGRKIRMDWSSTSGKNGKSHEALLLKFEDGVITAETSNGDLEEVPLTDLKRVRLVPEIDFDLSKSKTEKK